jgi:CubicO group peptidase (beta-lactamase class C family)
MLCLMIALSGASGHDLASSGAMASALEGGAMPEAGPSSERIRRVETGLLPPVAISGQAPTRMTLADRMRHYKTPGVGIAVIDAGRIEWARGYGIREQGGADPVTPETMFQAGSVSKAISAMAAMRLVQRHELDLDEDVNDKLVSWKVPDNPFTQEHRVTLRGLLSHSAGMTVHGFPGYALGMPIPTLLQVLDGIEPANTAPIRVDVAPGSTFRYSGGGFTVVQQLLIDVAGEPFPELMRRLVLDPLKMRHSTFRQPLPKALGQRAAAGHGAGGEMLKGRWHTYPEMAAAGLWSTPSDLARAAIAIQKAAGGASGEPLSGEAVGRMLSPQATPDRGLGWQLAGRDGTARFFHGGDTAGYKCAVVAYVHTGQGAVVMTNGDGGRKLVDEILRGIAKEYGWPDYLPKEKTVARVDANLLAAYVGQYALEVAPDVTVHVTTEADTLWVEVVQPSGREKDVLWPESDTRFFHKEEDFQVTFVRDGDGNVSHLVISQGEEEYRAKRVK